MSASRPAPAVRPAFPPLRRARLLPLLLAPAVLTAQDDPSGPVRPGDPAFERTWHAGVAELSSYDLTIERYGQQRAGRAILVYVTEPFRRDAQVKAETGRGDVTQVLKLNRIERFVTGIYDYSSMTSVFTPYDGAGPDPTLKITTSVQDWCGHVWLQLNRRSDGTAITGHSYFEREGEVERTLSSDERVWWEDGLWTRVRLAPRALPTGRIAIVPGTVHTRLRHEPVRILAAEASLDETGEDGSARFVYRVDYENRVLTLEVEKAWPHALLEWREELGPRGSRRTVAHARRVAVERSPYWSRNAERYEPDRDALGLDRTFREPVDDPRDEPGDDPADGTR